MAASAAQATSPSVTTKTPQPGTQPGTGSQGAREQSEQIAEQEEARWQPVMGLPCRLTVELPVPHFRVSNCLALRSGSVIDTGWALTRDVPLRVNGTLIAWGELEGTASGVGLRLTELA
jgi:flagellar motor switch/type III secretory pathway protein FliN